jgi:hypothetical protein
MGVVDPAARRFGFDGRDSFYFGSGRTEPPGLYRAVRQGDGYAEPERLPESINRPGGYTGTPFIAPDESYLLFYWQSVGPAGVGQSDLYVTWRRGSGWSEPQLLGPEVNTAEDNEFSPTVSADGLTLHFARNHVRSFEPTLDIAWENIFFVPVSRTAALQPGGQR